VPAVQKPIEVNARRLKLRVHLARRNSIQTEERGLVHRVLVYLPMLRLTVAPRPSGWDSESSFLTTALGFSNGAVAAADDDDDMIADGWEQERRPSHHSSNQEDEEKK
jgi:hypothetical protein